jgi:hypothetical protein
MHQCLLLLLLLQLPPIYDAGPVWATLGGFLKRGATTTTDWYTCKFAWFPDTPETNDGDMTWQHLVLS